MTSDSVVSVHFSEFVARNIGQLMVSSGVLSSEDSVRTANRNGENSGELSAGVTTTIDPNWKEV